MNMKRTFSITWAGILGLILLSACNNRWKALEEGFLTPPDSIRTAVYWYWLDNHISKEGVVKDLEAMKRVGITRAFIGAAKEGIAARSSSARVRIRFIGQRVFVSFRRTC